MMFCPEPLVKRGWFWMSAGGQAALEALKSSADAALPF